LGINGNPKDVEDAVLMAHKGGGGWIFLHLGLQCTERKRSCIGDTLKRIGDI
jgi:hypothetical protein